MLHKQGHKTSLARSLILCLPHSRRLYRAKAMLSGPMIAISECIFHNSKTNQVIFISTWSKPRRAILRTITVVSSPMPVRKPAHSSATSSHTHTHSEGNITIIIMELFHIMELLSSRSRHGWVNFESITIYIFFCIPTFSNRKRKPPQ